MEETLAHVDAVNDAEPNNEDVAVNVGDHSDSTQSQAKGRKSYTVGFKLAAVTKFDELGSNVTRASRELGVS